MSWKNPEVIKTLYAWAVPFLVIAFGALYRMWVDNDNRCISLCQIAREFPGWMLLTVMVLGMREYFELGENATIGLAAACAWLGPRIIVGFAQEMIRRLQK